MVGVNGWRLAMYSGYSRWLGVVGACGVVDLEEVRDGARQHHGGYKVWSWVTNREMESEAWLVAGLAMKELRGVDGASGCVGVAAWWLEGSGSSCGSWMTHERVREHGRGWRKGG